MVLMSRAHQVDSGTSGRDVATVSDWRSILLLRTWWALSSSPAWSGSRELRRGPRDPRGALGAGGLTARGDAYASDRAGLPAVFTGDLAARPGDWRRPLGGGTWAAASRALAQAPRAKPGPAQRCKPRVFEGHSADRAGERRPPYGGR